MSVVYIDILFIINFVMDYIVLSCGGAIFKIQRRHRYIVIAATVGAVYACAIFFTDIGILYSAAAKSAVGAVMVYIAYLPPNIRTFFRYLLCFLGTSVLFAGALFMFFCLSGTGSRVGAIVKNGVTYFNVPLVYLSAATLAAYVLIRLYLKYSDKSRQRQFYDIQICLDGCSVIVRALVDTGNSLTEPTTGKPVIIAEKSSLSGLSEDIYSKSKMFIIPFCALGTDSGAVLGFAPDYVRIINERRYIKDVIIGIYNGTLCASSDYRALINPEIFR